MEDVEVTRPRAGTFWSGRVVLVTGANGFIGGHLAKGLTHRGAQVIALVRDLKPTGALRLFGLERQLTVVLGTVTDGTLLERILRQYRVQTCFHLAAQALVGAAHSSPVETFHSNIAGTWTVLDACRQAGVEAVVASSDKAYGPSSDLPYRESHPLLATHPYDASKACSDMLARSFFKTYGLAVAVTRCANVYGSGDMNVSRLIPEVILSALTGRPPILRSDGTYARDFLYAADAVAAYLSLGEHVARPGVSGEAFNFGSGKPQRVSDVVHRILALAGKSELQPIVENRLKAGDEIPEQYLDSRKAERILGWRATTDLDEGLKTTIGWYRQYINDELVAQRRPVPSSSSLQ